MRWLSDTSLTGMGVRRNRNAESDDAAGLAIGQSVHEYPDPELGHFRHPPFSMWGAMKTILVLSLLLWWIPTIGQMIAGYIGGRRSGGPWRGVIAAIAPVAVIVALAWAVDRSLLAPGLASLSTVPGFLGHALSSALPPAAPYVDFVLRYLATFVGALKATLAMGTNGYLVTIVFAYIGGILADQARREARVRSGTSVGISIAPTLVSAFRRPFAAWEGEHPEQFDDLRKIPVHAPSPHIPVVAKSHKVDASAADSGGQEGARPRADARPPPERKELTAHDKEVATRRFVERALRKYEASHRR